MTSIVSKSWAWLKARASEKSTYVGVGLLAALVALAMHKITLDQFVEWAGAIGGALFVLHNELAAKVPLAQAIMDALTKKDDPQS